MADYNEVLKDFQNFVSSKTPEEKEIILNLIDEWTENILLGGVTSGKTKEDNTRP